MAIKSILTSQTDFTGEFPVSENTLALWRFNESGPDSDVINLLMRVVMVGTSLYRDGLAHRQVSQMVAMDVFFARILLIRHQRKPT